MPRRHLAILAFALVPLACSDKERSPSAGHVWLVEPKRPKEIVPLYQLGGMSWEDVDGKIVEEAVRKDPHITTVVVMKQDGCTCCQTTISLRNDQDAELTVLRSKLICHDEFPNH